MSGGEHSSASINEAAIPGRRRRVLWANSTSLNDDLRDCYERSRTPRVYGYCRRMAELFLGMHPELIVTRHAVYAQMKRLLLQEQSAPTPRRRPGRPPGTPAVRKRPAPTGTPGVDSAAGTVGLQGDHRTVFDTLAREVERDLGRHVNFQGRVRPMCRGRKVDPKLLRDVDVHIESQMKNTNTEDLPKTLNCLVYTGALYCVRSLQGGTGQGKSQKAQEGSRIDAKLDSKIKQTRRSIGWLGSEIQRLQNGAKATKRQRKLRLRLRAIFRTKTLRGFQEALERQKGILRVKTLQRRRRASRAASKRANADYVKCGPKMLSWSKGTEEAVPSPTLEEIEEFWKGIVGTTGAYDTRDPAVLGWRRSLVGLKTSRDRVVVNTKAWKRVLKKMANWKAPGPDGICAFWWKKFPRASDILRKWIETTLNGDTHAPGWLVSGRTVLIPKEGCQGRPDQYRPIACLNTSYKAMTAVVAQILGEHLFSNDVIPSHQKALRQGRRGCLDALAVDGMIAQEVTIQRKRMAVAWIDYQKAYDRVPHGWLLKALKYAKVPRALRTFLKTLTQLWSTVFTIRSSGAVSQTGTVRYQRGLFQGDSMSPLLYCLCIAPLSHALETESVGYNCKFCSPVTHTLFMDDLKVYSRSRRDLDQALGVVKRVSGAVGMKMGLRKCAVAEFHGSKTISAEGFEVPSAGGVIQALKEDQLYKYLGIRQRLRPDPTPIKDCLKRTFVARLRKIWKSSLSAKNKAHCTNSWAVSIFRYFFSVLPWSKAELKRLDCVVRRHMRYSKSHQACAAPERVVLPRRRGGRGIQGILHAHQREMISTAAYLTSSEDPQLRAVCAHQQWVLANQHRGRTLLGEVSIMTAKLGVPVEFEEGGMEVEGEPVTGKALITRVKAVQEGALVKQLEIKKVHGKFYRGSRSADINFVATHEWLNHSRLRSETEALILAAQDGVLWTRNYRAMVLNQPVSNICRKCHSGPETVGHILSSCAPHMYTLYKDRHDRVLFQLLLHLCKKFAITIPRKLTVNVRRGIETPISFGNADVRFQWDICIPTDRFLRDRRPDLVVYLKRLRTLVIFEMACAWEPLIKEREREKAAKYAELAADLATQFPGWKVEVAPLVIGDLGSVGELLTHLRKGGILDESGARRVAREMQYEVLCQCVRVLKRHLALS